MKSKEQIISEIVKRENLQKVNSSCESVYPKTSIYSQYVKRIIDILIATPAFILTLPINLALAIGTYITVGKPILFVQERTGKDGKRFKLYKFRSMTNERDDRGILLPPSERVTSFGSFIRRTSLDEFLNFYNVLKGDMSIIGPRPLPSVFDDRYSDRHKMRTAVKPGLECPSLVPDSGVRLYQDQFENDIWYVEHISFAVDVKMFIALIKLFLNGRERGDHATVGGGEFIGYDEHGVAFSMRRVPPKYEEEYKRIVEGAENGSL